MLVAWVGIGAAIGAIVVQTGPAWAAVLVHYAIPSVVLLVLIGSTAPRPQSAATRAAGCLLAFVLAYYAAVAVQYRTIPVLYAAAWAAAAVTLCPVGALAVRWAVTRSDVRPAIVVAGAAAVAVSDGTVGNLVRVALGRLDAGEISSSALVSAAVGSVVAVLILFRLPRDARTRRAAVLLFVPLAVVVTFVGWAVHFGPGPYLPR